jgi:hypothetical protein
MAQVDALRRSGRRDEQAGHQATDRNRSEVGNFIGISSDVVGALDAIKNGNDDVSSTAQIVDEQGAVTSANAKWPRRRLPLSVRRKPTGRRE